MVKKYSALVEVLKNKIPDIEIDKHTLVIFPDFIMNRPDGWAEFIMVAISKQEGLQEIPHLICLNDDETSLAMEIINKGRAMMYVMGHPEKEELVIWQLMATHDENGDIVFIGGENFRSFCDGKDLYYKTAIDNDGSVLSSSNCKYLKNENEDCRKPLFSYAQS